MKGFLNYVRRNPNLGIGFLMFAILFVFCAIGYFRYDLAKAAYPLAAPANKPPSWQYPLGTDSQGRELYAVIVAGTFLTLRIGVTAGLIGLATGTVLGFIAAYFRGWVDVIIKSLVDILLTIPGLMVLIIIASATKQAMSITLLALIIASLAWMGPTRSIRAQVLSLRERPFLQAARLSGMNSIEIIFLELMPNLLPYLAASLVGSVTGGIFASIGLEAFGLGAMREPTLGMTIYWVIYYSALLKGMWWWALAPVGVIIIIFVGLFSLGAGLDELANPRTRRVL